MLTLVWRGLGGGGGLAGGARRGPHAQGVSVSSQVPQRNTSEANGTLRGRPAASPISEGRAVCSLAIVGQ